MRVLFDGYWLTSGPKANQTVQWELLNAWAVNFPEDELVVLVRERCSNIPSTVNQVVRRSPLQIVANVLLLPRIAKRLGSDVVISHNFATPTRTSRSVVFIHDLMFLDHPEWFTWLEVLYFQTMKSLAKHSDLTYTSSETESRRVSRHTGLSARAIGLAVPTELTTAVPKAPTQLLQTDTFSLIVGRLNVRKNLERAISGALLSGMVSPECPLVVVGEESGRVARLDKTFNDALASGALLMMTKLSAGELAWLYSHTSLFVFLSLDEGFGMPALEARYFGAKLLLSDISVFREQAGDFAVFANPYDVRDISKHFSVCHSQPRIVAGQSVIQDWASIARNLRADLMQ